MIQEIIRTEDEIAAAINEAASLINYGDTKHQGMNYWEGIQAMYALLLGSVDNLPKLQYEFIKAHIKEIPGPRH